MCGICGSFAYHGAPTPDPDVMRRINEAMRLRGPDGQGEWSNDDRRVWLGHRRLAIIDLSERGAQPMLSWDGRMTITFNGEIYNYKALRQTLEAQGHRFRSESDTEVLIELYRSKGPEFVSDLRGMFAFALWDSDRSQLLLARDPYGIKPLYYADSSGMISFASSVKALMHDQRLSRTIDPAGAAGFFVFGSVPEPWTIYAAVRALPAGCTLLVGRDAIPKMSRYHSIAGVIGQAQDAAAATPLDADRTAEALRQALLDSVRHHLVADVPVSAFLSAGVDSGALVGLMRDAGQADIQTITLAYAEYDRQPSDEAPLAELTARDYDTRHTTRRVTAAEFHADLPKIMTAMDQPSIDGINTWFVAKATRELGLKVAISGVGGDELLGGYSTFDRVPSLQRALAFPARIHGSVAAFEKVFAGLQALGLKVHPKISGLCRYGASLPGAYLLQRCLFLPEEVGKLVEDEDFLSRGIESLDPLGLVTNAVRQTPSSDFGRVASLESMFYLRNQLLRDTDWAGMAHSLEIRTPLVDSVLLSQAAGIMHQPDRPTGKAMLAAAPRKPLRPQIVNRQKTGFQIPVETWLADTMECARTKNNAGQFSRHWALQIAQWNHILPNARPARRDVST